jgi:hypothetical protein
MDLEKFTIFGERNSGTNYLQKTLQQMLYLKYTNEYGFKHWYIKDVVPRGVNNTTTDNECIKSINDSDDTLIIVIVRNIYDWVGSMYKKPYHIKNINTKSIFEFVSNKYIAYEKGPGGHKEGSKTAWLKNKNHKYPYFMEEADNLIELRNLKNNHFYNLRNRVKHYYLIRQEYLVQDIINMIQKFNLKYKITQLNNYKQPNKYALDKKTLNFIHKHMDNRIDGIVADAECWKIPGSMEFCEGEKVCIEDGKTVKIAWYGIDCTNGRAVPLNNIYNGMIVNNNMGVGDPVPNIRKKLFLIFSD